MTITQIDDHDGEKAKEIAGACGVAQGSPDRGDPVAWQFRQRSGVGKGPQSQAPWCDWCGIEKADYDNYVRHPNKLVEVRPLYASPPAALPAGLSEEERHAVEHARYQVERATPNNPECGFDYDLVKDLICAIDRAYPLPSTDREGA